MASRHQPMNWRDSIWVQTRSRSRRSRCIKATQRLVPYSENKGYASNPRRFDGLVYLLIAVSLKTRLPEGYCKCMCERERERERESFCLNCVCFTELVVWINPLIAVSLQTRLLEGYCKCMCPLGTAFLMPPGWRLHRLGPAITACSYIFN